MKHSRPISKKHKNERGFTLIELLVVISIIGMLSTVVMASLGALRRQAKDSSAMQSMGSMRNAANLAITQNGNFPTNLCSSVFSNLIAGVQLQTSPNTVSCVQSPALPATPLRWAASVRLNNGTNFCVDSTNYSGEGIASVNGACGPSGS